MFRRLSQLLFVITMTMTLAGLQQSPISAQGRITHTITSENQSAPNLGRDLWFCIPQNYAITLDATRYFYIYISSPRNTTAYIKVGNSPVLVRPITANQTTTLSSLPPGNEISKSTELQSSDLIENKAIHVWSNDAELSVYFLSRAPFTTDGMYVIPTIGWGTEYVVASYNAFIIDPKLSGIVDLPSEFCIVASQDNTFVTIVTSSDIRQDGFSNVVAHPKGQQFSVVLNKGQCIQYQTTTPPTDQSDLTGTKITSDKPIGVIGASVCPNVPPQDPSCDHILEMIPPVRVWANTYFSAPFSGRKFGGDGFLVVGTKQGQVIYRNGVQAAALSAKFDFAYIYDVNNASAWTSDTSFLVVQYVLSSTHAAPTFANRNNGDPAMVVINPADQFGKKIIFQIATQILASGQANFTNYLNLILPTSHESKTTMDGRPLNAVPGTQKYEPFPIPGTQWEAIRLTFKQNQGEGTHVVVSDTGIGMYLYGYTRDDSYAWAGALGVKSPNTKDTIAPKVDTAGLCFCSHIKISDVHLFASKLNSFNKDTSYNILYYPDPNFVVGAGTDSSYYDICIIDSSKEAYIEVSISDIAGNLTTVKSIYKPSLIQFKPSPLNFGGGAVGVTQVLYDTLFNPGTFPFDFKRTNLILLNGAIGFVIDSTGVDGPIPPGGFRIVRISFTPVNPPTVKDTMQLSDNCSVYKCPLIGNGGAPDFVVSDHDFFCVLPNTTDTTVNYLIVNNSPTQVRIDSIWVDDPVHFAFNTTLSPALPFFVPKSNVLSGQKKVFFTFTPTAVGPIQTVAHFLSKVVGVGEHTAILKGTGCAPSITSTPQTQSTECQTAVTLRVPFVNTGNAPSSIIKVTGSDTIKFTNLFVENGFGVNIPSPFAFDTGSTIYADVTFVPPARSSGCFEDTITLHGSTGGIWVGIATVCTKFREIQVAKGNVVFPTTAFGSPKVQNSFKFCNSGKDSLTILKFDAFPSKDSGAFKLTGQNTLNGTNVILPIVLAKGECVDVFVEFDPAFVLDTGQLGYFGVISNDCVDPTKAFYARANTTGGPSNIQGFVSPTVLSCDIRTDTARVTNSTLAGVQTITGITISGPNAVNFASSVVPPIPVAAKLTVNIPIDFRPTASAGAQVYNATVTVVLNNGGGFDTLRAPISGTSQGYDLSVNTTFSKIGVKAGDKTAMFMNLSLDKHGLNEPLDVLDIRKVVLTYNYDIDVLDVDPLNIAGSFTSNIPGWTLDNTNSSINNVSQTITLIFLGTAALPDAATSLGFLNFTVTLPKTGSSTSMTLTNSALFNGGGFPVGKCLAVVHQDTSVTWVYQCGDSTLIHALNGDKLTGRIIPVSPNPVTSSDNSTVSFRYALRHEATVSLSIFDALGREVDRIENVVRHPAGTFEVFYNTRKLSGGSYVFRFTFDENLVQSGRLVIDR